MLTSQLAAGFAVVLALLFVISRRLDGVPRAVWSLMKKERDADAPKALDAMTEAVAVKAGVAVIAIQRHEENIAADFRVQVADAEMRARISERRAADTVIALQAATALVHELRAALDAAKEPLPSVAMDGDQRDDDEKTRVGKRPCIPPPSNDAASISGG